MKNHWSEKVALITGGASGIGRAIARALAAEGCRVVATGLTLKEVETFQADCQAANNNARITAQTLDVADDRAVGETVGQFDRLDILINCAGMILREGREHDPAQFARVVDVNLCGVMRTSAACRTRLAEQQGCVVNIASMLSFFGSGAAPAYSASKGGVAQLTKSLAIAWAGQGVRVNAIAPGWIQTPLTQPLVDDAAASRRLLDRTPLGRWGRPEDVSGAALFLCSPAAEFVTGVILPVDGGFSIA